MKTGYAFRPENESFVAKAQGVELRIKFKHAVEICNAMKGMKIDDAISFLEKVIDRKALVPFKRTKTQSGHKKGLDKWPYGKQPVKATRAVLEVLKSARSNAEFRGLNLENCIIISAIALRSRKMMRAKPKGRHALYRVHLTTVQITIEEVSE
ncbi:MAG: 50S ribosomal protein L22 [Candidatus Altiarchaeota archaeon]|nr:50S ribosomal protein L22 [Candidatus Altiarchaeota archaeon]